MKCRIRPQVKRPKVTQWKCIDCQFELQNEEGLNFPIVCKCGRIELRSGEVRFLPHVNPATKYSRFPISSAPTDLVEEDATERFKRLKADKGRKSWKMLHTFRDKTATPSTLEKFFKIWKSTIPKDCACVRDANEAMRKLPPDFSSYDKFHLWGFEFHNLINQNLTDQGSNHPQITLSEFHRQWDSKFALWQPVEYGGLERWSISLAKNIPCFGVIQRDMNGIPDPDIIQSLNTYAPNVTLSDAIYHEVPIIASNIFNTAIHRSADLICVAHGICQYTEKWISDAKDYARSFVGVSDEASKLVERVTGKPCKTIENGVDVDRLISSSSRKDLRGYLGIPEDAYVVGYTGRTSSEKNIQKLMKAVSFIDNAYLVISGWRSHYDLEEAAIFAGIPKDRFIFLPAVERVGDTLALLDCFVSCSSQEGFGLSVMEAMLFGLPVAASNVGIVKSLTNQYVDIGCSVFEPEESARSITNYILKAKPCSVDISKYTASSMAERWNAFLLERAN